MIDRFIDWYLVRVIPAIRDARKESAPLLKDISGYGFIYLGATSLILAFFGFDLLSNPYGMGWEERASCTGFFIVSACSLLGAAYKLNVFLKSRWLTESQAINIAIEALETKFGKETVLQYRPYRALLKNGLWHVHSNAKNPDGQVVFVVQLQKSRLRMVMSSFHALHSRGLTLRSTRTPPALPSALFLRPASSAPFGASMQAGPVSFIR